MALIVGNTIQLQIQFTDIYGTAMEVNNPITQVYDEAGNQIGTDIYISNFRVDVGLYYVKYTIPNVTGEIVFRSTGYGTDLLPYVSEVSDTVGAGQYDPNLSRDSDKVRFLLQDTDESNLIMQNTEINFLVQSWGDYKLAAIAACDVMAAKFAKLYERKELADLKVMYRDKIKQYTQLAANLKSQMLISASPYAGGLSQGELITSKQDTDAIQPLYSVMIGRNNKSGNLDYNDLLGN